jgi:hypothetical protein
MRKFVFGLMLAVCAATNAVAQIETVVVTASRREEAPDVPGVTLVERADHLVVKVRVICDTRDATQRAGELRQTLKNMIAEAGRGGTISLSTGDEVLYEFNESKIDKEIGSGSRPDTSEAFIVIRTELSKTDNYDEAVRRIYDFIKRTPKSGRTEILKDGDFNLGLMKPERYRPELVAKIAEDSKRTAALFGTGHQIRVEGLQHSIQWFQSGQLDLSLYIPYALIILPNGAP